MGNVCAGPKESAGHTCGEEFVLTNCRSQDSEERSQVIGCHADLPTLLQPAVTNEDKGVDHMAKSELISCPSARRRSLPHGRKSSASINIDIAPELLESVVSQEDCGPSESRDSVSSEVLASTDMPALMTRLEPRPEVPPKTNAAWSSLQLEEETFANSEESLFYSNVLDSRPHSSVSSHRATKLMDGIMEFVTSDAQYLAEWLLFLNQLAYSLGALPIGVVLSIAPLYLKEVLSASLNFIGVAMMSGEILGVLFMQHAEVSRNGFLLSRPNDLYLILLLVGSCLLLIPVWPKQLWPLSAFCMVCTQAFNAAMKPVVAESVHRLALATKRDSSQCFAKANKWRRACNAIVCAGAPFVFAIHRSAAFFVPGPVLAVLVLCFLALHHLTLRIIHRAEKLMILVTSSHARPATTGIEPIAVTNRTSNISVLGEQISGRTCFWLQGTMTSRDVLESTKTFGFYFVQFLIVHVFSFLDAFISRLPFAVMSVAIAEESEGRLLKVCVALFCYQSCRTIGQAIQENVSNNATNMLLSSMAVCAYVAFLAMLKLDGLASFWFIPVIWTGLSETLPVQQMYLMELYGLSLKSEATLSSKDSAFLRMLVKASHKGTGFGSAVAFLTASIVYTQAGLDGFALLGLGVSISKIITILVIMLGLPRVALEPSTFESSTQFSPKVSSRVSEPP